MGWAEPPGALLSRLAIPPIGRDSAARAARRELGKAVYARYRPGLIERVTRSVLRFFGHLLDASGVPPGFGVLVLLAVLGVLAALTVRVRLGAPRTRSPAGAPQLSGELDATSYRRQGAACAGAGDWAGALLAATRALSRGLEQRGVLRPQAGRTASELAAQAGRQLPTCRPLLVEAAARYDRVRYGARTAAAGDYRAVLAADDACSRARLRPAGAPADLLAAGRGA